MNDFNRIAWGLVFILGTALFGWMEWNGSSVTAMGWFMLTSLWSAVCGIGYTIVDWVKQK